ncbi:MAG: DUF3048 domain-containing protein [Acidothermus cellulolyticus]|nr:DUF3048 domain-containing protein [Acidothermus cellulolyticus]
MRAGYLIDRPARASVIAGLIATLLAGCSTDRPSAPAGPQHRETPTTTTAAASSLSASLPDADDPLTGRPAADPAAANRPALAIKVDNVAGAWPQAGLNSADIVFDIPVEGGLTRLLAVFHSQLPDLVGPIRSARPVDADLLPLFGRTYFAFSGGTASDLNPIRDHGNAVPMWWDTTPSLFIVRRDHAVPHQVFASPETLYAAGRQRDPSAGPPRQIFPYSPTPANGRPVSHIVARYAAATAEWSWNGSQYLRTQDGRPDMLLDGRQVSSDNVVILGVTVKATTARDSHGSVVPLPVVIGSGTAWIFRNGMEITGTWNRPTLTAPLSLRDVSGTAIALAPGRTWVELLPTPREPVTS